MGGLRLFTPPLENAHIIEQFEDSAPVRRLPDYVTAIAPARVGRERRCSYLRFAVVPPAARSFPVRDDLRIVRAVLFCPHRTVSSSKTSAKRRKNDGSLVRRSG